MSILSSKAVVKAVKIIATGEVISNILEETIERTEEVANFLKNLEQNSKEKNND